MQEIRLSPTLIKTVHDNGRVDIEHWCPACDMPHAITITNKNPSGASWTWNNDVSRPTFSPSVNVMCNAPDHPHFQPQAASSKCHYFLREGKIEFLGDCTHPLAGQTVELPEYE